MQELRALVERTLHIKELSFGNRNKKHFYARSIFSKIAYETISGDMKAIAKLIGRSRLSVHHSLVQHDNLINYKDYRDMYLKCIHMLDDDDDKVLLLCELCDYKIDNNFDEIKMILNTLSGFTAGQLVKLHDEKIVPFRMNLFQFNE